MTIRFNDGVEFDTSGELHIEHRKDGWYVVGEGYLIPANDEREAREILSGLRLADDLLSHPSKPSPTTKPKVKLIGRDGNAFAIIGACHQAARTAGWSEDEWRTVRDAMMAGDYDHLLGTAMEHFDVD